MNSKTKEDFGIEIPTENPGGGKCWDLYDFNVVTLLTHENFTLGNFTPFRARADLRTLFSLVTFKRAHCIQI